MELVGLEDLKFSPISGEGGGGVLSKEEFEKIFLTFMWKKDKVFSSLFVYFKVKACACYFFQFFVFSPIKNT